MEQTRFTIKHEGCGGNIVVWIWVDDEPSTTEDDEALEIARYKHCHHTDDGLPCRKTGAFTIIRRRW
jgi:hypothetical protein